MYSGMGKLFGILLSALAVRVVNAACNALQFYPEKILLERVMAAPTEAWLELARWTIAFLIAFSVWGVIWFRRWRKNRADTLDHKIEFEWGPVMRRPKVPDSGYYNLLTLAPIPEEVSAGAVMTIPGPPGDSINLPRPWFRCKIANHSGERLFDVRCVLQLEFHRVIEDLSAVIESQGARRRASVDEHMLSRTWNVRVSKLDDGGEFVFYITNPNEVFVQATAPDTISFKRLGSGQEETAILIPPSSNRHDFWPEMSVK